MCWAEVSRHVMIGPLEEINVIGSMVGIVKCSELVGEEPKEDTVK